MTQAEKLQTIAENELKVHEAGYKKGYADRSTTVDAILDKSITSISSNTVTILGYNALTSCASLESVDFPNVTEVQDFAFTGCPALKSINLPNFRENSGEMSFAYCESLSSIDLPKLELLGYAAFEGCSNLTSVTIRTPSVCRGIGAMFDDTPIANYEGYIYVPADLVDSYKSATNWSKHASQIRAIQE